MDSKDVLAGPESEDGFLNLEEAERFHLSRARPGAAQVVNLLLEIYIRWVRGVVSFETSVIVLPATRHLWHEERVVLTEPVATSP